MRRYVYLAGPILNCTEAEAKDWRRDVAAALAPHNIIGVSPLRCEPLHGERYSSDYTDPRFGTPRAIAAKNRFDVAMCDMGLIYIPKPRFSAPEIRAAFERFLLANPDASPVDCFEAGIKAAKLHSFGTVGELFWSDEKGKQTILVSDDPFIMSHPVIDAAADWKLSTFAEAVEVIIGVLGAYTGGKNI